jgi:hypothetical protein
LTDGEATNPTKTGQPNYPEDYALSKSVEAKNAGIAIFTIGLGGQVNSAFLESIASSPDHYYFAPNSASLSSIYGQIATAICQERPNRLEVIPRILTTD